MTLKPDYAAAGVYEYHTKFGNFCVVRSEDIGPKEGIQAVWEISYDENGDRTGWCLQSGEAPKAVRRVMYCYRTKKAAVTALAEALEILENEGHDD